MQATATTKHAEALAHEIASHLSRATVVFDSDVNSYVVRVTIARVRYELVANAPAGIHALFRKGRWHCGVTVGRDASPAQIAAAFTTAAR
jgi:hypothetical protein